MCRAASLLLLIACSRSPAPLAVAPIPRPEPAPAPALPRSVDAPAPAPAPAPSEPALAPRAEPALAPIVSLEPPYSELGHPRLATEMASLERDEQLFQWALGGSSEPNHPANQAGYHPATRVVVDIELQSRAPKGTTKRLLRIARSDGYWPLRACFEAAERLAPRRERSAMVRLTLGASGKVLGSRSLRSSAEKEYARCVLERVRALDFRPGFTRKLDVDISVKQWPGHAPVPPRAPEGTPPLVLPPETRAALDALQAPLGACYAEGLKTDAKLWGRVALRLESDASGVVAQASAIETRFPSASVVECIKRAVLDAHIAAPSTVRFSWAVRLGQPPAPPPPAAGAPASPVEPVPPSEPEPPAPSH